MKGWLRIAFRVAVAASLTGVALREWADHASAGLPWVYLALLILPIVGLYPPLLLITRVVRGRYEDMLPMLADCVFSLGSVVGFGFGMVIANGHSEPNWARGYGSLWLNLMPLTGLSLLLTWTKVPSMLVRSAIWCIGIVGAVFLPDMAGGPQSAHHLLAILVTSAFWLMDVALAQFPFKRS